MSGAVAAHAAYNGSGTQGLAVTNKIHDDDDDVMSVFWNKNDTTRQLLYGSSIIEIPSSGASTLNYGSSRLFTVNNDIDCLGDMYLQLTAAFPTYALRTAPVGRVVVGSASPKLILTSQVDHSNDLITSTNHGFGTGTRVVYSGNEDTDLGGLATDTTYFVIRISDDTFKLATTLANAIANTAITLSGNGNNGQTITPVGSVSFAVTAKTFSLQSIVERIEIQVGTQIWQTIENHDLRVVSSTELTADAFSEISNLTSPSGAGTASKTGWIVIPSLTKTLGPRFGKYTNQTEDGYPMAAAPHQSVKIKVYFREFPTTLSYLDTTVSSTTGVATTVQFAEDVPLEGTITPTSIDAGDDADFKAGAREGVFCKAINTAGSIGSCNLYAKQQIMCNEEREQMKAMPMGLPKRLKMTQNAYTTDIGSSYIKTIDLDHFSLYASHIIISGNAGESIRLKSAELKLNSSSYSGQLPGILLDSCTSDSLGLYSNKYIYSTGSSNFIVDEYGIGTYVFPLAATAYGGSCVPLNRFDSIRLTLTFTSTPQQGASTFVNVTCVGETTALFKGGAASLAMY